MTALIFDSMAHLLVDGLCAATLFGPVSAVTDPGLLILVYNTLAFSTQALVGVFTDRLKNHGLITALACLAVALGYLLPLPAGLRVMAVGLGNSLFHVGGGTRTLLSSGGRAWRLGVFVAPGSVGLVLGKLYPDLGLLFAALLLLCAVGIWLTGNYTPTAVAPAAWPKVPILAPILLLTAVAIRAFGGTAVAFPWKTGAAGALMLAACVFAGKFLGGFTCDRIGVKKAAWLTVPLAAALTAFLPGMMAPALLGQLLLNMTMPITLYLLYKAMPDSPGFAFGLAASVLWPGTLAGSLVAGKLPGPGVFICLAAGLAAILISHRLLERKGKNEALKA